MESVDNLSRSKKRFVRFDSFVLDLEEMLLFRLQNKKLLPVPLPPKASQLLVYLVDSADKNIRIQDACDVIGVPTGNSNAVHSAIKQIRRAIGDNPPRRIVTKHPVGSVRFMRGVELHPQSLALKATTGDGEVPHPPPESPPLLGVSVPPEYLSPEGALGEWARLHSLFFGDFWLRVYRRGKVLRPALSKAQLDDLLDNVPSPPDLLRIAEQKEIANYRIKVGSRLVGPAKRLYDFTSKAYPDKRLMSIENSPRKAEREEARRFGIARRGLSDFFYNCAKAIYERGVPLEPVYRRVRYSPRAGRLLCYLQVCLAEREREPKQDDDVVLFFRLLCDWFWEDVYRT